MTYNFSSYLDHLNCTELLSIAALSENLEFLNDNQVNQKILQNFSLKDIQFNQETIFKHLLIPNNQIILLNIKNDYLKKLKNIYQVTDPLFDEIEAFQVILSIGLWKYHLSLNEELERFVRDFDRIDDDRERIVFIDVNAETHIPLPSKGN